MEVPWLVQLLGGRCSLLFESARFSDPQLWLELFYDPRTVFPGDAIEKKIDCLLAQLVFGQFDGCEFGTKYAKPGIVIETHQAEVFGAAQAHFLRGFQ